MTSRKRVFLGFAAGFILVLVKILQPDQEYVRSLFSGADASDIAFYIFLSIITICLGGASGLFSSENEPMKVLVFCASVPALISTASSVNRTPASLSAPTEARVNVDAPVRSGFSINLISSAHAQTSTVSHVCVEEGFVGKFATSAGKYLTGSRNSDLPNYAVVVASVKDFQKAKSMADNIARSNRDMQPWVGCRRPGNPYYPVAIGQMGIEKNAYQWKARFEAAGIMNIKPFLSNYSYRRIIYKPSL